MKTFGFILLYIFLLLTLVSFSQNGHCRPLGVREGCSLYPIREGMVLYSRLSVFRRIVPFEVDRGLCSWAVVLGASRRQLPRICCA